ncbi:MAG: 30S ribosomal protein S7 [Chloroflexota bacterium]|nr:MAG: 30S ribosomal protein S7 [Chloroflexota bacterium]
MPRRGKVVRREAAPDPKYHSKLLAKFINKIMFSGKKSVAERIVYDALTRIETQQRRNPLEVFEQAIKSATPILEVKPRRVGGATYQVPIEIRSDRRLSLAMRWLVNSARARSGKTMAEKLAGELMDAAAGTGATIKRREDLHRMADANKAFAHYRW